MYRDLGLASEFCGRISLSISVRARELSRGFVHSDCSLLVSV